MMFAFGGDDVGLNVIDSKVAREHDEDPTGNQCFLFQNYVVLDASLWGNGCTRCGINSPLWVHGCSGGTGSSNGGGGTSRLLGVQARRCDERFCRLWIQASMIVHEGCTQPGETCWNKGGKHVFTV